MKGLKGVDPQREPNDLVVFIAAIGWIIMLASVLSYVLDWIGG